MTWLNKGLLFSDERKETKRSVFTEIVYNSEWETKHTKELF